MYKLLFYLLIFSFSSVASFPSDTIKARIVNRDKIMQEQIIKLKNGVLLIRLQSKHNAINALMNANQQEQAEKFKKKQENYNKEIINAFRKNFTFCPFYFFFVEHTENVKSKDFEKVIFVNDSLQPDASIKMANKNFLIGEFGIIEQDTAQYFSNYYYEKSKDGPKKKSAYYGGADLRFEALRILSDQFIQLAYPFPYYVKASGSSTDFKKMNKVVVKMNNNLAQFYNEIE